MSTEFTPIRIAPARESDVAPLFQMARREAEYEKLMDQFTGTEARLREALFGTTKAAEALLAWYGNEPVGFAVFFPTFSTFSAERGLYLEDLFVEEAWRGHGVGRKLLAHLASRAVEGGFQWITWSVLKWNEPAIAFYRSVGAEQLEAWHHFLLSGESLQRLAQRDG